MYEGRIEVEARRAWAKVTGTAATDPKLEGEVERRLFLMRAERLARRRFTEEENLHTAWEPSFLSGAEFLATPDPAITYRVAELWPRGGNVVLVAKAKAGKTTLVLNLLRAMVTGEEFLDRFAVEAMSGTVCLMDLEMSETTLRRWMRDLGLASDNVYPMPLRGRGGALASSVLDPEKRATLAKQLRDRRVEVLIIDPLAALLAGAGVDENSNSEVSRLLRAGLDALREEAVISELLVVHHAGHGADRARGASALRDWPDATWTYVTSGKGDDDTEDLAAPRFLAARGRDVELPATHVSYHPPSRRLTIDMNPAYRAEVRRGESETALDDHMIEVLKDFPDGRVGVKEDWVVASGKNRQRARQAIDRLESAGRVERVPGSTARSFGYQLCDDPSTDPGCNDRGPHDPEEPPRPSRPARLQLVPDDSE